MSSGSEIYLYKIRIKNTKECEKVQKRFFELGIKWNSGSKEVLYLEQDILCIFVVKENKDLSLLKTISKEELRNYLDIKYTTIEQLFSREFEMEIKKQLILLRLEE